MVLAGELVKIVDKRCTPSGIPITRFVIEHHSEQNEAGLKRNISCQVLVIASGSELTTKFEKAIMGKPITVTGYLNQTAFQGRKQKLCINAESIIF